VPAGKFVPPEGTPGGGPGFKDVPSFCRVRATLRPSTDSEIGIEVWLPAGWNGKLQAVGNGGWSGSIGYAALGRAVVRGYAGVATDTGHQGARASFAPGHPEKVLMARREFAEKRAEEHIALLAALLEACEFCDDAKNQTQLVATLARPEYVGTPEAALRRGIRGEFDFGRGRMRTVRDFAVFHQLDANEPTDRKMAWVLQQLRESNTGIEPSIFNVALGRRVFRQDIFEKAIYLRDSCGSENAKLKSFDTSILVK